MINAPASAPGDAGENRDDSLRRDLLDSLCVLAAVLTTDGRLLEASDMARVAFGVPRGELIGASFQQVAQRLLTPKSVRDSTAMLQRAALGETVRADLTARLANGELAVLDCTFRPLRDRAGTVIQIATTGVDVTEYKQTQLALKRLNRDLRLLSDCNRLVIRAHDEQQLLDGVCRIAVDTAGYTMAWVGYAQDDADKTVHPVSVAGLNSGYIEDNRISWAAGSRDPGATGSAVRDHAVRVSRGIDVDALIAPRNAHARTHGYNSCIALPLFVSGSCIGALTIYSANADSFDSEEIELLSKLAEDLSYGIETLRTRKERDRAFERVELFDTLVQHAQEMMYVVDAPTGRLLEVNDSGARLLQYSREELLQLHVEDFSLWSAGQRWPECSAYIRRVGNLALEGNYRTRNGAIVPVECSLRYVEHAGAGYITVVTRDVSDRQRQRDQIDRLNRILRMQSGINSAVLRIVDRDELLQEACRLATEVGGYDRAVFSLVDPSGMTAIPCFRAGAGADFPEPAALPIGNDAGLDLNLSSRALRTGQIAVNSDLTCPEPPVALREQLLKLGYRAMAALPLIVEGRRIAALVLTTRDANLVADEELLILLQDMMSSLSFALRSKAHADAAQYLAYFDPLTGLAKRSLFLERLADLLEIRSGPYRNVAVIAFDLRGLNRINDTYGRGFGDHVLMRLGERLRSCASGDAHVAHFGGGSFALLDPAATGDSNFRPIFDDNLFGQPFVIDGQSLRLSCSYGVAHYPRDGSDAAALMQRAEAALKHAKDSGEPYLHYRLEMHSEMADRLALEHRLSVAIAADQFELHYQPQLDLSSGRIEAVEGLLRWNDPSAGLMSPHRFLTVLESTGMILRVGEWVLHRAVADCERWFRLKLAPVRVAINVSAVQLRQRAFTAKVLECCKQLEHCAGFGLDLEITESMLLQDLEGISIKLQELRAAGVRIALDDFGTGYSALGLLPKLPVDILKIDKAFVGGLPDDPASVVLVETVLRLASAFKLRTVAEGVETEAQLQSVSALHCDAWQGYLHSAPMTVACLEQLLSRS